MSKEKKQAKFETLALHAGQEHADTATGARAVPIYQTTSYVFKDTNQASERFGLKDEGNIYGRLTNPTEEALEKRLAALEGGSSALAVASGAAAITYVFQALAQKGDHIVSANTIYGGTYNYLCHTFPLYGVETTFVDPSQSENFETAIKENTKLIFFETLGNPNSNITNIEEVAAIAHKYNIPLVIDNTFATPYLLRLIDHGADIVVHSATKFIGGHGTSLGGIIVESGTFDYTSYNKFKNLSTPNESYHGVSFTKDAVPAPLTTYIRAILLRDTGACISPFNAFLLLQGVETLSLRVERHVENVLKVVSYLDKHEKVAKVNHPSLKDHPDYDLYQRYFPHGAGSIFTFDVYGGEEEACAFIDNLKIFSNLANVADVKSLVIHPATTTHSQLSAQDLESQGIGKATIRLSIGTEHIDDIIEDIEQALEAI